MLLREQLKERLAPGCAQVFGNDLVGKSKIEIQESLYTEGRGGR
jgi:hypothetical protein